MFPSCMTVTAMFINSLCSHDWFLGNAKSSIISVLYIFIYGNKEHLSAAGETFVNTDNSRASCLHLIFFTFD